MPAAPHYRVIDTAPESHVYTGGLLCNLQDPSKPTAPDYICGELTWDGQTHSLIWHHWNGHNWIRSVISSEHSIAVGMDSADLTGNGRADIAAAEWPLGSRSEEDGHVLWFEHPDNPYEGQWVAHVLATGWGKAHDLVIGDIGGQRRADVLVRLKDGRISWFPMPEDPRRPWSEALVAEAHPGDGTALYDVTGNGCLDIVTGSGFFENQPVDGRGWKFHPFQAAIDLQLDPETRVVVGDCLRDRSVTVVISESEQLTHARLVALNSKDGGQTWSTHILIDGEIDLGALHSLQLLDTNGNGWLDIFVAEMELYVEDDDIIRRPTWNLLLNRGDLLFDRQVVLDENLGAHMGFAGRISRESGIDFIAKNWKANRANAWDGLNHVVHVGGWLPAELPADV